MTGLSPTWRKTCHVLIKSMPRIDRLIVLFAVLFAVMLFAPALVSAQLSPYPLLKYGDVIDLLTPFVLMPLYWLLFRVDVRFAVTAREIVVFVLIAALWAQGQGMHLAANSIGHLLKGMETSEAYALTHFYDEVLSHVLWHLAIIGMVVLMLWRQWRYPLRDMHASVVALLVAALIYGFTTFVTTVEAGTVLIGLPFSIAVVAFGAWRGRGRWREQPLLVFFAASYLLALVLLVAWGVYWRGFPQFSEIGIIE